MVMLPRHSTPPGLPDCGDIKRQKGGSRVILPGGVGKRQGPKRHQIDEGGGRSTVGQHLHTASTVLPGCRGQAVWQMGAIVMGTRQQLPQGSGIAMNVVVCRQITGLRVEGVPRFPGSRPPLLLFFRVGPCPWRVQTPEHPIDRQTRGSAQRPKKARTDIDNAGAVSASRWTTKQPWGSSIR
jgi:hypothetical protein